MNVEDIAETLPNGLHDLLVQGVRVDFAARVATFDVSVWMGSTDEPEDRRAAELTLHGLQYLVMEPPDTKYPYAKPEPLWFVDLLDPDPKISSQYILPSGAFASRFFVNQWNAFVHLAALQATLTWK